MAKNLVAGLALFLLAMTVSANEVSTKDRTKVLIVPGHDEEHSGAVFEDFREADMNLLLARKIRDRLDPSEFDVKVARDWSGYDAELEKYFEENEEEVSEFIAFHKEKTAKAIDEGQIVVDPGVRHNDAPKLAAYRLYAINKWAGEQKFDMVIHVHFNDEHPRKTDKPGKHSGFAIYIPSNILPNYSESHDLGESVGKRMAKSFYKSNLPLEMEHAEEGGVIPDYKLIAIGSNGTLEIPSILVEYAYIFEPSVSPELIEVSTGIMAEATATGIADYVNETKTEEPNLKFNWKEELSKEKDTRVDVAALQYALFELGLYPPIEMTQIDCPVTGIFGPCTERAVKDFQIKHGLKADGVAGEHTIGTLNYLFK